MNTIKNATRSPYVHTRRRDPMSLVHQSALGGIKKVLMHGTPDNPKPVVVDVVLAHYGGVLDLRQYADRALPPPLLEPEIDEESFWSQWLTWRPKWFDDLPNAAVLNQRALEYNQTSLYRRQRG